MINFDALRGDTSTAPDIPADGTHTARLERISIWEGDKGERLITEWSDDQNTQWTSWNRFDASGMSYTQELLDGLGIDRSQLTDENLADELTKVQGGTYQVRTESKPGSRGDGKWFTSTYITQPVLMPQPAASPDVPVDTSDFVDTADRTGGLFDDGDIPF